MGGDAATATALGLPGLAFDYVGNPGPLRDGFGYLPPNPSIGNILPGFNGKFIQGEWALNGVHKLFTYGPNRRTK